ncbi:MAG: HD domain-containing phosphohydrolase, partial [Candidatus Saccharibacteria bacterium]
IIRFPVEIQGTVIGYVGGNESTKGIAKTLSLLASREVERKSLAAEALDKYKEISLLHSISEMLAENLDPKEVTSLVFSEAKRFIKADSASVILRDEQSGNLQVVAGTGKNSNPKIVLLPGQGIAGLVMESGKPELINDVNQDSRFVPGAHHVRALMSAPLKIRDRVIGVINVSSKEPEVYSAEDLKILSSIALHAASAIETARLYDDLRETFLTTVYTLAETIEKRDPYTGGHTKRVMTYSIALGNVMGFDENEINRLELAAMLHDIGKIGVRDEILLKPGKLTDEEYEMIKMHTVFGEQIIKHIRRLREVIPGVKWHHERFDGRGYPDRIGGEEIDIIARIIAVADSFDAMTSDRAYRKALSNDIAIDELIKNSGTQFDPHIVEAFLQAYKEGKIVRPNAS